MTRLLPDIAAGERARFRHAALSLACLAAAAVIARSAGTSLFLQAHGAELLPQAYLGTVAILVLTVFGAAGLAARIGVDRLLVRGCLVLGVTCLLARLGLLVAPSGFAVVTYFLADLVAKVLIALLWGLAALLFDPRESKRLLGLIGAAGTTACLVAGLVIPPVVRWLGTEDLLVLVAALLLVPVSSIRQLRRVESSVARRFRQGRQGTTGVSSSSLELLNVPLVRNASLLVLVSTACLFAIDYGFMTATRPIFIGEELAAFLGRFYAAGSFLALPVQLFLVQRILRGGGVLPALLVLPTGLLVTAGGWGLTEAFGWIFAAKLLEPVLFFTVDAAAVQALYQGLTKSSRSRARMVVEGLARPIGALVVAVTLALVAGAPAIGALALGVVLGCLTWMLLAAASARSYRAGLLRSLGQRRLDLDDGSAGCDAEQAAQLRHALRTASGEDLPYLLSLAEQLGDAELVDEHASLLHRSSSDVKVRALRYLKKHGDDGLVETLLPLTEDESSSVRAAALETLAVLGGLDVLPLLEARLADDDPVVRATAATRLVELRAHGALGAGGRTLTELVESADPADRAAAAIELGKLTDDSIARPLSVLLGDDDRSVRRAALRACAVQPRAALVEEIAGSLDDPHLAGEAVDALVPIGAPALPRLLGEAPPSRWLPLLTRLGPASIPALRDELVAPSWERRREIAQCLARVPQLVDGSLREQLDALAHEAFAASRELRQQRACLTSSSAHLLRDALMEERQVRIETGLLALEATRPGLGAGPLAHGLRDSDEERRARALDALAESLPLRLRAVLLAAMEDHVPMTGDEVEVLATLLVEEAAPTWVTCGALHAVRPEHDSIDLELVSRHLDDARPVVRETALAALDRLAPRGTVLSAARALTRDPSRSVSQLAAVCLRGPLGSREVSPS
ncbi:MAG: HEAT repeat domain-containing protein [Acidobacteriota bacterium]